MIPSASLNSGRNHSKDRMMNVVLDPSYHDSLRPSNPHAQELVSSQSGE